MTMVMPLIIGLPGAGKGEVNREMAKILGREVLETDQLFRKYRAISSNDNRPEGDIMRRFLERVKQDFSSPQYEAVREAALQDPTPLADGKYFRTFGEAIFRTFETVMVQELDRQGAFKDVIVDVSSSMVLKPENRAVFNKESGYSYVFLDTEHDVIVDLLYGGFRAFQNDGVVRRGAYEKAALAEIEKAGADTEEVVRTALSDLSQQHRAERASLFRQIAEHTIAVSPRISHKVVAWAVIDRLRLA